MGSKKLTYEFVKNYIKNEGYKLLSKKYVNSKAYLKIQCNKGHIYKVKWNDFKQGYRCAECAGLKRLTHEYVNNYIEERGYKLISKSYEGAHAFLTIQCDKKHLYESTWNNFRKGYRCPECAGLKRLTYKFVKEQFAKEEYELLSETYKNSDIKLEFMCPNNHKGKISYHSFRAGQRCRKCWIEQNRGENHPSWKGGVVKLGIPLYDTYAHQIDWIEQVRRNPDNEEVLQVKCTESGCRKWFTPTRDQVYSRIKALNSYNKGESSFYCSEECKHNCSIYNQQVHPKGYKSDTYRDPDWAEMVKERDGHECKICGSKEDVTAHHYESIWSNPIESADLDMGITLCKKCHVGKAHTEVGCRFIDQTRKSLCREAENKKEIK